MLHQPRIIGFRGIGFNPSRYPEPKDRFVEQPGLIKAGHVGISLDEGKTIFGSQPTPEAIASFPSFKDLLDHLQAGKSVAGGVYDDTAIFWQAHRLALTGVRTQVWQIEIQVDPAKLARIDTELKAVVAKGSDLEHLYRYPDWEGLPMPQGVNNCATWPRSLGLDILEPTGQMRLLIKKLEQQGFLWP